MLTGMPNGIGMPSLKLILIVSRRRIETGSVRVIVFRKLIGSPSGTGSARTIQNRTQNGMLTEMLTETQKPSAMLTGTRT